MMNRSGRHRRAFTVIELIVIIGIIGLLMAILIPAVNSAQDRSRKLLEGHHARSLTVAWNLYGNTHSSAATPGFLSPEVQQIWRVRYEFPLAPDPAGAPSLKDIPAATAAPWTWRLLSYVDYDFELIWGYRQEDVEDLNALVVDPRGDSLNDPSRARDVAYEPAFGYNGFHVGGVYCIPDGETRPRFALDDAVNTGGNPITVVSRSMSNIKRPDQLVLFSAATRLTDTGPSTSFNPNIAGWHIVTAPDLGEDAQWYSPPATAQSPTAIQVVASPAYIPLPRHTPVVTAGLADGSTGSFTFAALTDRRHWIDQATERFFSYSANIECPVEMPDNNVISP